MKIDTMKFGIAWGISFALIIFIIGIIGTLFGCPHIINEIAKFYMGFGPTLIGSLIGAAWGFGEGFIAGSLIAFVYNRL